MLISIAKIFDARLEDFQTGLKIFLVIFPPANSRGIDRLADRFVSWRTNRLLLKTVAIVQNLRFPREFQELESAAGFPLQLIDRVFITNFQPR